MVSSIYYIKTLFEKDNLTPICGKHTFKMFHNLRNNIKANAEYVYSNIGGGAHGHINIVITEYHHEIISNAPFVYTYHPVPLIITDGTTNHNNSTMHIINTKAVHLFRGVIGLEQDLI